MRIAATIAVGALLVALVVAASIALSPGRQSPASITSDALGVDAQSYASDYDVTVEEARRRLNLQASVGSLDEELAANESATFAGLWIEHQPNFRIIALFINDGAATVRRYITDGPLDGLVEVRAADATLNDLVAAQNEAMTKVSDLNVRVESLIDVKTNRVKMLVVEREMLDTLLTERDVQLPSQVDIVTVSQLSQETIDLFAGLELDSPDGNCTSGFSVLHSDGTKGITTAAHCTGNHSFDGKALSFRDGRLGAHYDVKWYEGHSDHTLRGLMKDGPNNRYVYGTKSRSQQAVGEYVCRYGVRTGAGCGEIYSKNVQPTGQQGCKAGCTFSATFVLVEKTSGNLAVGGDSGGPWFSGNTAYGIMRSRGTAPDGTVGEVYMPINYISVLDVSVITE